MKVDPAKLLPVRYPAYHALAELNRSFEQTIDNLGHLTSFNFFRRDQLRHYQMILEETRCLVNQELTGIIGQREFDSSVHYQKLRLAYEKHFNQPSNSSLGTTLSEQQLKKQKGKQSGKPRTKTR